MGVAGTGAGSVALGAAGAGAHPNGHVAIHWHRHQPIYWPETNNGACSPGTSRCQFAYDSIRLKRDGAGNCFPGRSCGIESSGDMEEWNPVPGSQVTAGAMDLTASRTLPGEDATGRFYRVRLR